MNPHPDNTSAAAASLAAVVVEGVDVVDAVAVAEAVVAAGERSPSLGRFRMEGTSYSL